MSEARENTDGSVQKFLEIGPTSEATSADVSVSGELIEAQHDNSKSNKVESRGRITLVEFPANSGAKGSWWDDAACEGLDTNLFFPTGESKDAQKQTEKAKAICASCVVRAECLNFAVVTGQDEGIWGETTPDERRSIRRSMQRQARAKK